MEEGHCTTPPQTHGIANAWKRFWECRRCGWWGDVVLGVAWLLHVVSYCRYISGLDCKVIMGSFSTEHVSIREIKWATNNEVINHPRLRKYEYSFHFGLFPHKLHNANHIWVLLNYIRLFTRYQTPCKLQAEMKDEAHHIGVGPDSRAEQKPYYCEVR